MASTKLFKNKPYKDAYGIYQYSDDNSNSYYYSDSTSIPIRYDKFEGKDLYTNSIGHYANEAVLDSKIQNKWSDGEIDSLSYLGESYLRINRLQVKNRGVRSKINDVYFHVYIFSKAFFDPFESNGKLKSYTKLVSRTSGFRQRYSSSGAKSSDGTSGYYVARFWKQSGPNYGRGKAPGNLIENVTILQNFDTLNNADNDPSDGTEYDKKYDGFNPLIALKKEGTGDGDITTIFQEDESYDNPIYIAIHMDGDQDTFFDRSRNETVDIWKIDPNDLFDEDESGGKVGKITSGGPLNFSTHTAERFSTNQSRTAAFSARKLSVTINTQGGVTLAEDYEGGEEGGNYRPPLEYIDIVPDIDPPFTSNNFDSIILNAQPQRQIINDLSNPNRNEETDYYTGKYADFLPIANINMSGYNVQNYYSSRDIKSMVSTPGSITLEYYIDYHPDPLGDGNILVNWKDTPTNDIQDGPINNSNLGMVLNDRYTYYYYGDSIIYVPRDDTGNNLYPDTVNDAEYMFFVVDWDDKDNKYKTIDDVLDNWPRDEIELLKMKEQNLYIPKKINKKQLFWEHEGKEKHKVENVYSTPGIKTIKTIMFSYDGKSTNIEALRWKLITSKIYLDIPVNEFPDFSEIGGADYVTLPWPHTTPVIGGVSQDSKYIKSINDTLGGGNIGDNDIIDQTFLVEAQENDELGNNIQVMDLEQIRFFNKSYDMNKLLNIPTSNEQVANTSPEYLATLPFPEWAEEFDIDSSFLLTGDINLLNADMWTSYGRPDIADWINRQHSETEPVEEHNQWSEWYSQTVHTMPTTGVAGTGTASGRIDITTLADTKIQSGRSEIELDIGVYASSASWQEQQYVYNYYYYNPNVPEDYNTAFESDLWHDWDSGAIASNYADALSFLVEDHFNHGYEGLFKGFDNSVSSWNSDPWIMIPLLNQEVIYYYHSGPGAPIGNTSDWLNNPNSNGETQLMAYQEQPFRDTNGLLQFIAPDGENLQDAYQLFEDNRIFYPYTNTLGQTNNYDVNIPGNLEGLYFEIKKDEEVFGELFQIVRHTADTTLGIARLKLERGLLQEAGWSGPRRHEAGEDVKFYSDIIINEDFDVTTLTVNPINNQLSSESIYTFPEGLYWPPISLNSAGADQLMGNEGYSWSDGGIFETADGPIWQGSSPPTYEPGTGSPMDCDDQGKIECWDGTCADSYSDCPPEWTVEDQFQAWANYFSTTTGYEWNQNEYQNQLMSFIESNTPGSDIIAWAQSVFWTGYFPSPPSGTTGLINTGCDLPDDTLYLTSNGTILYNSTRDIAGFQLSLLYQNLQPPNYYDLLSIGDSGDAVEAGFTISHNSQAYSHQIIAFSLTGNPIPAGCGSLLSLNITPSFEDTPDSTFTPLNFTFSSTGATELSFNYFEHTVGCVDDFALNYDPDAFITWHDSSMCEYPQARPIQDFYNYEVLDYFYLPNSYVDYATIGYYDDNGVWVSNGYWDGSSPERTFPEESSVGQIFIYDNLDLDLISNCSFELNTGDIYGKSLYDSSGNLNKGLLMGDYKIKKNAKGQPMRRDSFIKIPKKTNNKDGAL